MGCADREKAGLMNIRSEGSGPDEFSVTTHKPLELPQDLKTAELPIPTPGAANRADITVDDILETRLGIRPGAGTNDAGFVRAASRLGVSANIRETLATEDAAFRSNKNARPLERLARVNVYFKFYADQTLDAYTELARLRRLGVVTPNAAPPEDG